MLIGNQLMPGFQNGYLFYIERGSIQIYSPEGFPMPSLEFKGPNATGASAMGLAIDTDSSVAVSYGLKAQAGYATGIAFFDRNGQSTGFIDTGRYLASNLSFGPDHSLWTFGWQRDALKSDRSDSKDYMMVHRYSPDRKAQGTYLPRSLFPEGLNPGAGTWQFMRIAVGSDRVGLFAWSGMNSSQNEWVELDLNGNLIRRVRLDERESPVRLAFTSDGHLYRQINKQPDLQVLDQTTSDWRNAGPAPAGKLWGSDGKSLVFSPNQQGPIVLQWFEQPTLKSY